MALTECPECGDKLSDQAESCPHCGYVVKPKATDTGPSWLTKTFNSLKADFTRLWGESRKSLTRFAIVMLVTTVIGLIVGKNLERQQQQEIINLYVTALFQALGKDLGFSDIFPHNLTAALLLLAGGLWLRALPWLIIGFNGIFNGMLVSCIAGVSGTGIGAVLFGLMLHGIPEYSAIIVAAALGLKLNDWKRLKPDQQIRAGDLRWIVGCFWLVTLLLVIAAAIEALPSAAA